MNRISQFLYDVTNAPHICRNPAKFLVSLQTVQTIKPYCLSGQHGYTRRPLANTNASESEKKSQFQKPR